MKVLLETALDKAENFLSTAAVIPVFSVIPGSIKMVMGNVQCLVAIGGVALGCLRTGVLLKDNDWSLAKYSAEHIKHGVGNIVAGAIEAPFGLFIYLFYRRIPEKGASLPVEGSPDETVSWYTNNCRKWFHYDHAPVDIQFKAYVAFPQVGKDAEKKMSRAFKRWSRQAPTWKNKKDWEANTRVRITDASKILYFTEQRYALKHISRERKGNSD